MFGRKPPLQHTEEAAPNVARASTFTTDGEHLPGESAAAARHNTLRKHFVAPVASDGAQDSAMASPSVKLADVAVSDGVPDSQFFWYGAQGFIGYQASAIIAQHWLVDKACLMPARDAIRMGYECKLSDEDARGEAIIEALKRADKRYKITQHMREFIHFGRVYGLRLAIFRVESSDPEYYEKPFNPDSVTPGSYLGISQVDPLWVTPLLTDGALSDPSSIRFYEPEFWSINGRRYHRSHCCLYIPFPVPDSLKPQYLFGGKSLPQLIYERVYAAERTANEAPQLAMTKRQVVFKTNAEGFWSNIRSSVARLNDWITNRDNYGAYVIDKESEDLVQHDTSLDDLDAVIMNQYQLVSAIAEVPATKLLGTTPKGFNATGEAEAEDYRIMLESIQTNDLEPLLARHHQLVWLSDIKPKIGGDDVEINVQWLPLDSPTAGEWADINLKKAQEAQIYANIGAIDGEDVRERLQQDKESNFYGLKEKEFVEETEVTGEVVNGLEGQA